MKPRRILDRNAFGRQTERRPFDRFVTKTTRRLRVQKKRAAVRVLLGTGEQVRPEFNARTVATARAVSQVMAKAG